MVTKKKASPRKKTVTKKTQKKVSIQKELKKVLFGIVLLVFIVVFLAMLADIFLNKTSVPPRKVDPPPKKEMTSPPAKKKDPVAEKQAEPAPKQIAPSKGLKEKTKDTIKFEIFDDVDTPVVHVEPPPAVKPDIPQIAIIIDDIGYDRRLAKAFCNLDINITFSILPMAPFGREIAETLHAKGAQLMLHLPMEPMEYPLVNPGPGAILADMSPDVLLSQLKKNLDDIPYILGVNNHMGSRITSISENMNQIFTILKKRDLFFIDSRTASNSQCKASARLLNLKFATRDVFIDNIQEPEYIRGQLKELIDIANKKGTAIGIGHPYKATLQTLETWVPQIKSKVEIVPAKNLTALQG